MKRTIYVGADHAGLKLKQTLARFLRQKGFRVVDKGAKSLKPRDDYPDYAFAVGKAVAASKGKAFGILACGSAEGMCIAANKVKGVRAVAVWTLREAKLTREHNDANVLCLSGWSLNALKARRLVNGWLGAEFCGEARHARRIAKIARFERR